MNGKIYLITCFLNDKKYVGQTIKSLRERWLRHIRGNWGKKIDHLPIQLAFKKYGIDNFKIELLEENINDQNKLNELEIHYSKVYNTLSPNGYNLKVGERNGLISDETREKFSKINLGRKASLETIKKLSESHIGNKHSIETRKKLSDFFKGKKPSENTRLGVLKKILKLGFLFHLTMKK